MNLLIKHKQLHFYEGYYRKNIEPKDTDYDYNNYAFPYPEKNTLATWGHSPNIYTKFLKQLDTIQNVLIENKEYKELKPEFDLLDKSNKTPIGNKEFVLSNFHWKDSLIYYLKTYFVHISKLFLDFIMKTVVVQNGKIQILPTNKRTYFKVNNIVYQKDDMKYLKITRNQMMIMDALMEHGGRVPKYLDNKQNLRYSEHSGILDFDHRGVERIILNTRLNIEDPNDKEIFFPTNMLEAYDFEYIFHTHPPTPTPGARAVRGVLYEFPSTSDIFHFIEHYNEGQIQGSIVIAPEGIYIIRAFDPSEKKIKVEHGKLTEDDVEKEWLMLMYHTQRKAIKKYGTDFTEEYFFRKIAQDQIYIRALNDVFHGYGIDIFYKPREKDQIMGKWILPEISLPVNVVELHKSNFTDNVKQQIRLRRTKLKREMKPIANVDYDSDE